MSPPDLQQRRTGILLHPTSLPSGTLDSDVERWLQMLADADFSVWQMLPLGEPHGGLSPYQCSSAFALNPALLPATSPAQPPDIDESDSSYIAFCNRQNFWLDDYVLFKVLKLHFDDLCWVEWPQQWKFREADALQQSRLQYQQKITELKWQQYQLHKRWLEIRKQAADRDIVLF
ncbi:MAG: 4-alpha-glucanotransferase, partial [Gammaproteobacteria bacterium]|nr:4-alpha-glucanotransferase [Gammaproteobacteria bacterium]